MNTLCKTAALGLVAGALALSTGAQAQTDNSTGTMAGGTMSGGTMSGGTMSGGAMSGGDMSGGSMSGGMNSSMTPMPVTGTVLRYYVDRAGFVSAMDVQAADGVKMVRFSPSMAQRLTGTYPVGSQISAFATSSGMGTMMNYDLAGVGTDMPSPTSMMMPMNVTDLDVLRSVPYIMTGSKVMRTAGTLTGYISDPDNGQVLAIILDNTTLVRVPMNNRLPQASTAPEGVTPLFRNSDVVVSGIEEAPRYGVVSPYSRRIVANSIVVNGRVLGPFGFGAISPANKKTLLNFNLNFFGGAAPREVDAASSTGFSPYMAPGTSDMSGGMAGSGTMSGGTGTGTMSGGMTGSGTGTGTTSGGTGTMPGM